FDLDLSALSLPGLTRQSIILRRLFFFATDARVRLARDRSEIGAGGMSRLPHFSTTGWLEPAAPRD
ncbi:MAG: hypothetical protein K8H87_12055, partial [Pseudorhodoplanes sp.]|nr:hypothetical protein [Pseudorhodoplanes sp.]